MSSGPAERFERALHVVSARLKDEFGDDLIGLLLGGSAAYGTPMPNSDVDLFVLIRPSWRQRRNKLVEDVEVEMFINPVPQIRREIDDGPNATTDMFARGRIMYDPAGVMAQLVEHAQRVEAAPPQFPDAGRAYFIRYGPSDLVRDTEDLLETDPVAAEMLLGITLQTILEAHWRVRGRRPPKPKYLLRRFGAEAPSMIQEAERIMDTSDDLADRVSRLRRLCDLILEPIGGLMLEGETPPEQVPEAD